MGANSTLTYHLVNGVGDNLYTLTVSVSDGNATAFSQTVTVTVTDIYEPSQPNHFRRPELHRGSGNDLGGTWNLHHGTR